MFESIIKEIKDFLSDYVVTEYNGKYEFSDSTTNHVIYKPSKKYATVRNVEFYTLSTEITLYFYQTCNLERIMNAYNVTEVNEDHEAVSRELGITENILEYTKVVINYQTIKSVDSLCYSCS